MRTRDEQLEEIFDLCRDSGVIGSYFVAKEIMTEIEQRVRAEIGRDSERLDYLCRNMKGDEARRIVGVISDTGCVDLWRAAIDAAQENAND